VVTRFRFELTTLGVMSIRAFGMTNWPVVGGGSSDAVILNVLGRRSAQFSSGLAEEILDFAAFHD
jgi:hypothetical protein